ncbi:GNAT family N-acetyltransferase [Jannaschia pohangensis]|uniref:Ribosomal-protein-alanine N-acetyltransferase n=1 Tax=Jannaschia pohangensis TaxID=390807 RepID=A0A1I3QVM9_9RHOB|nr:GNAT family N-acetyltransferase [Jannaschia pohangensis]SFJ38214.1 ribosomal-protein-alanine N-acetyltransferase [Jannaschia pohangensis]
MARLHAVVFAGAARWSEASLVAARDDPAGIFCATDDGFVLGRVISEEAELLTLVVDPTHRRRGAGRALLADFEDRARRKAARKAFLEVAADNAPALALYLGAGWGQVGRRGGYYDGTDALILRKML